LVKAKGYFAYTSWPLPPSWVGLAAWAEVAEASILRGCPG